MTAAYAQALPDVFAGFLEGSHAGERTGRFLREGGGMAVRERDLEVVSG